MTVAVAWIRTFRDCEELIFVSDSRLSGDGRTFDACPKILTLPRSDCAICFAGYTGHAFPLMLQLALAIDSHAPSRRGSLDITAVKSHALKVFDGMAELIKSSERISVEQSVNPNADFLFGGYSWVKKRFELWLIGFDEKEHRFIAREAQWLSYIDHSSGVEFRRNRNAKGSQAITRIAFAGDQAEKATNLLSEQMAKEALESGVRQQKLNMQPFEIVRNMLRDSNHSETIGGSPQLTKVYQYMQSAPL
jgi:hypothetical protein